jgi:outer membrane protein assembly factor BamA
VVWNKKDLHSYYLNFGYSEHWLFNTPFSFKVDFKQSQTDSTYSQVSVEQQTLYRLSRHLTIASLLSGERVFQKGILKSIFPSGRKLGLGFKLSFNNTDSRENPRQGWEFSALIKIINWRKSDTLSTIQAKTKDRLVEDQQTLSRFIPTWADQSMAFKLSYARVRSQEGDLSPAELFKIGGMGTLRGYLQEQFWSDRVFLTSLEYRFLLKEQGRFYLFTDMAHFAHGFFQNGDLVSRPAFKLGYGLGFWLPSRLGFLGLDLGLGQSDQLNDLKVHLSVQNRF